MLRKLIHSLVLGGQGLANHKNTYLFMLEMFRQSFYSLPASINFMLAKWSIPCHKDEFLVSFFHDVLDQKKTQEYWKCCDENEQRDKLVA